MKRDSTGDVIVRIQALVQRWGWSLAMSAVLELRDEHDGFVMTGEVHDIARVVHDEARYRYQVQGTGGA